MTNVFNTYPQPNIRPAIAPIARQPRGDVAGALRQNEPQKVHLIAPINRERILPRLIDEEIKESFINYSMSVIVSRALPDVRDGLKPVHRRILYAMHTEGLHHNKRYSKCAGVVGEVLKKYHPHGDSSVYDTLVRLAQNWVMRYPLIDPQGNFGSVDGDPAAAYRYTECKMTRP